jgi:anti-sigma-K factor RskA
MTDIHEAASAYAVDALDAADLAEFEAHLASCSACRIQIVSLRETAAELSLLSLAIPPASLRDNVLAAIRTTPQVGAVNEAVRSEPPATTNGSRPVAEGRRAVSSSGPRRAAGAHPPEVTENPDPGVDELALRRQHRLIRILSGLVAAMLALAVGLGGVIYTLVQERQAQVAQTALEEQLYAASDAVTTTTALAGGGQVTFVASKQLNRALFLGTDLPDPGQNRYQLWTATGTNLGNLAGVARDVQIADIDPGVKVFFSGDVRNADFLAVNLEPAGSSPEAPTNSVLAAGPTTT